ncbi:MAG: gliding motility-associated C-terminal domain-containing protein [Candidatus Cloacimonetes bacterium]|jgi:hypothetical protein|nr:gliding motility-associated C-terminal domain-containing protein [Candidatus Cloacimonadota bacterium]MDD3098195.1 gliding motility-associated C-terminal domain-containing protein [Candidatus Cloacimonadota bacterium]MDD3579363.1 gliding motility-associated C-terminal domain-containing protein [Candidatus Cloacimonadota bacterium]MDD5316338.1 gliding motility-associated C-terminal domain-containing protein [Candidatus Cloacimonadota bacterium]
MIRNFYIVILAGALLLALSGCSKATEPGIDSIWLGDACPNPLQIGDVTDIPYKVMTRDDEISLTIVNSRNQEVYYKSINQGDGTLQWDGRDRHGRLCAEGVYFYFLKYRMEGEPVQNSKKILILY